MIYFFSSFFSRSGSSSFVSPEQPHCLQGGGSFRSRPHTGQVLVSAQSYHKKNPGTSVVSHRAPDTRCDPFFSPHIFWLEAAPFRSPKKVKKGEGAVCADPKKTKDVGLYQDHRTIWVIWLDHGGPLSRIEHRTLKQDGPGSVSKDR